MLRRSVELTAETGRSTADELVELVIRKATLLHSPDKRPWARIAELGAALPMDSAAFRRWLDHAAFAAFGIALPTATINTVLRTLQAQAMFAAPEQTVYTRVAEHDGRT